MDFGKVPVGYKRALHKVSLAIMFKAHKGQFRHDGVTPYTVHPLALADLFYDYLDKVIANLHDAIEDGRENGVTYQYIHDELSQVEQPCIECERAITYIMCGIGTLTHYSTDSYQEYIRIKVAPTEYRKFKIGDITVNLSDTPTDYQKKKYKKAMQILLAQL